MTKDGVSTISDVAVQANLIHDEFNNLIDLAGNDRKLINEAFEYATTNLFTELRKIGVYGLEASDVNALILLGGGNQNEMKTMNDLFVGVKYMINGDMTKVNEQGDGVAFSDEYGDGKNPYKSQSMIKMLAQAAAMRELDIAESSILASGGKTYFAYSNPTYISNKLAEWKNDQSELWEMYADPINKNSRWLNYLLAAHIKNNEKARQTESTKRLNKFESSLASSFTSKGKDDGVDNTNISLGDQINDNLAKLLRGSTVKGGSLFPTIIAADKSRRVEFKGLEFIESKIYENAGEVVIPPRTIGIFTKYFADEYNRMIKVAREIDSLPDNEKIIHYHLGNQNGLKSQVFPEFSIENIDGELKNILYKDDMPVSYKTSEGLRVRKIWFLNM